MKKIVFTPELKQQFSGILPMDKTATWSFTPESLRPLVGWNDGNGVSITPMVTIKQWDNDHVKMYKRKLVEDVTAAAEMNVDKCDFEKKKFLVKILSGFVDSWFDIFDFSSGEEIKFIGDESLEKLTETLLEEIANEIAIISGVAKRPTKKK